MHQIYAKANKNSQIKNNPHFLLSGKEYSSKTQNDLEGYKAKYLLKGSRKNDDYLLNNQSVQTSHKVDAIDLLR